jgi:hypothetical protein
MVECSSNRNEWHCVLLIRFSSWVFSLTRRTAFLYQVVWTDGCGWYVPYRVTSVTNIYLGTCCGSVSTIVSSQGPSGCQEDFCENPASPNVEISARSRKRMSVQPGLTKSAQLLKAMGPTGNLRKITKVYIMYVMVLIVGGCPLASCRARACSGIFVLRLSVSMLSSWDVRYKSSTPIC